MTQLQAKLNLKLSFRLVELLWIVNAVGEVDASLTLVAEQWLS
jgi:hypothetical protein